MPEQRLNILVYRPDGTLIAQYLLGDGEHLIGRDINCPVYLDSEYISSNHAKLHLSQGDNKPHFKVSFKNWQFQFYRPNLVLLQRPNRRRAHLQPRVD